MDGLGQRIRQARLGAGMTREHFAVALNVSFSTVGRWETDGTSPTLRKLAEIAQVTGKALSFFVTEEAAA